MFQDFKIAYLLYNFIFLLVWLILFLARKDLRYKMLLMSVLIAPMGPLSEHFYLRDYWRPELINGWRIGLEDLLFGFCIGGIASVVYEEIFAKQYSKRHSKGRSLWLLIFIVSLMSWVYLGNSILGINSIYVSVIACLGIGALMITIRHDLLRDAFYSAIIISFLMFISYMVFIPLFPGIIQRWWQLHNLSGVLIFGVPVEELMWGFGWGLLAGPIYEFITGLRLKKIEQTN